MPAISSKPPVGAPARLECRWPDFVKFEGVAEKPTVMLGNGLPPPSTTVAMAMDELGCPANEGTRFAVLRDNVSFSWAGIGPMNCPNASGRTPTGIVVI